MHKAYHRVQFTHITQNERKYKTQWASQRLLYVVMFTPLYPSQDPVKGAPNPPQAVDNFFGSCGCLDCVYIRAQTPIYPNPTYGTRFICPTSLLAGSSNLATDLLRLNFNQKCENEDSATIIKNSTASSTAANTPQMDIVFCGQQSQVNEADGSKNDLPSLAGSTSLENCLLNSPLSFHQKSAIRQYYGLRVPKIRSHGRRSSKRMASGNLKF
jgi:hypothetical protein